MVVILCRSLRLLSPRVTPYHIARAASWDFPSCRDSGRAEAITFEAMPVVHHSKFWGSMSQLGHSRRIGRLAPRARPWIIPVPGRVIAAANLSCCTTFDVLGHKVTHTIFGHAAPLQPLGGRDMSGGCN